MKHLIWVYGTLKRGKGNHRFLSEGGATFLGNARTEPAFTMLHLGGFPGVVRAGKTVVHGELYEVNDEILGRLDRLEGHPNFYQRQQLSVVLEDGSTKGTEGYFLPDSWLSRAKVIEGGVWAS